MSDSLRKIVAIGDIHGHYHTLVDIYRAEEPCLIVQVGDLTDVGSKKYPRTREDFHVLEEVTSHLVWVKGNHENWGLLSSLDCTMNLTRYFGCPLGLSSKKYIYYDVHITGLGGNYSQKHFKDKLSQMQRHYTESDIRTVSSFRTTIMLSHEAFEGQGIIRRGVDVGQPTIAHLVDIVEPSVFLSGHHHQFHESYRGKTLALSLDYGYKSYVKLYFDKRELCNWETISL